MNQARTPLFDALMNHKNINGISLHVPGHKSGEVFLQKGLPIYKELLSIDVTELTGLDDLHEPEGSIYEAELLLSELYGSNKSFLLVNGSTVGNLVMVLSVCGVDDTVIVARNCHKSVMNGLMIAGALPIFVSPEFDREVQVPTYVSEESIRQAIDLHPEAKAVIITNPNYYGHTYDLTNIITYAHARNIPVLVDEAHGAHFCIGEPFPSSAIKYGADMVVHSAHKTLPAMTMGSYLHFQSNLISLDKVKFYLKSLQSSSPSYPIMASLDLARAYAAQLKNKEDMDIFKKIEGWKDELQSIPQINVVLSNDPSIRQDPLKVTIQTRTSLSGFELQSLLEAEGIYSELADPLNVLFILPLETDNFSILTQKIRNALGKLDVVSDYKEGWSHEQIYSEFPFSYSILKSKRTKFVTIEEAENQLSAETVIPYPPGIPLMMYGEKITKAHIDQFKRLQDLGARFQGSPLMNKLNIFECE